MTFASLKIAGIPVDERTFALSLIACSILVGIANPTLATRLEPLALPALFLVVLASLVPFARRAPRELVAINSNVMRILCWQQLLLPSLVIALGVLCRLPDHVIALLVVTACSGALFAAPALAALLDLNQRQSLQCMVLSTLLMPFTLYMFLGLISLQTGAIHLDLEVYSLRIMIFLGIPALLFIGYRRVDSVLTLTGRKHAEMIARWVVVLALAVFGIGMMKSVADRIVTNPHQVYFYFCLTTALCIAMLEPYAQYRKLERAGDYTSRLALMEEAKTLPFGAVWARASPSWLRRPSPDCPSCRVGPQGISQTIQACLL